MALATKPKPPAHTRKRQARHHRQSKIYLKAYHPYLPMVAIVGLGVIVNQMLYGVNLGTSGLLSAGPLATTRAAALTGHSAWALPAVVMITALAAAVFAIRYWYRLRRVISRGETFLLHHSWLDIVLVAILTTGVILTRNA